MNMKFDDDIPPPTRRTGPKGLYDFGEMAVGQSFAVPVIVGDDAKKKAVSLRVCAHQWAKRAKSSAKFSVAFRRENDLGHEDLENGLPMVRVWRIA